MLSVTTVPMVSLAECDMRRMIRCGSSGRFKFAKYMREGTMHAVDIVKKHEIITLKQVDDINREKFPMSQIPTGVNEHFAYIIMEVVRGGELITIVECVQAPLTWMA